MNGIDIFGWAVAAFMIAFLVVVVILFVISCFPHGIHLCEFKENKKYRYETRTEDTGKREYSTDYGYVDNVTVHRFYVSRTYRINKKTGEEKLVRTKEFTDDYSFYNY